MKKYRISTTISARHEAILKKHMEDSVSQQKVIEQALECLEDRSKQLAQPALSSEEVLRNRISREVKSACIVQLAR